MINFKFLDKRGKGINIPIKPRKLGGLRLKIFIMFFFLLIILLIYHTYFEEEGNSNSTEKQNPKISDKSTITIFSNLTNNKSGELFNPSIAINKKGEYVFALEFKYPNGSRSIMISRSSDIAVWGKPEPNFINLINSTKPFIIYVKNDYYVLSFQHQENNQKFHYISTSANGIAWSLPEISELYFLNNSIYYDKDFILYSDNQGLKIYKYEDLKTPGFDVGGKYLIKEPLINASILKTSENDYILVYENPMDNYNSFKLTKFEVSIPQVEEKSVKWDLLIIFTIIGCILLIIIIQEIARE